MMADSVGFDVAEVVAVWVCVVPLERLLVLFVECSVVSYVSVEKAVVWVDEHVSIELC